MMTYELDDIEKEALLASTLSERRLRALPETQNVRPGERVQTWWCEDCQCEHTGSVLGGPIGDPHGEKGAK